MSGTNLQVTSNNNTLITYTEPYFGPSNIITVDSTNNTLVTYVEPYNTLLAIDSSVNQLSTYIDPYNNLLAIDGSVNQLSTVIDPYNNLLAIDGSVNQLSTVIDPYNILLVVDGSVNQLSTVIDPVYPSPVTINNSNNKWITYIDAVPSGNIFIPPPSSFFSLSFKTYNTSTPGPPFTPVQSIDVIIPSGTYTLSGLASTLQTLIQSQGGPSANTITVDWNVTSPNRYTVKSPTYFIEFSSDNNIKPLLGYTPGQGAPPPYSKTITAINAPTQTPSPNTDVYVVSVVPNGNYTFTTLATAMTNAYTGYNITVTYDSVNQRFVFNKSGPGAGLFQFVSSYLVDTTTINSILNMNFGVSANSQITNLIPISGTGITAVLTIPNNPTPFEYTPTSLATAITTAYTGYSPSINITCTWNTGTQRFVFTKSPVVAGDPALFKFNACSIESRIGTLPKVTSANPQTTSTAPNFTPYPGTGITAVITVPNNPTPFEYTQTSLATAITTAYSGYSPSIGIVCIWNTSTQRFNFSKTPVISGDPGLFRFNACTIESRIGTLPKVTSANPQSTSTAPNYTPYPGTGITAVITIPNNPTAFEYTQTSLATAITTAYAGYSPSIGIVCTWNAGTQRFNFSKTPVISGDPALFRFNACSIESRIGTLPTVTSANPQSTSTTPNYTPYPGTGITAVITVPDNPNPFEYTATTLATAITTAYVGYSPSIGIVCTWNDGTQRFNFSKSPVTSGDPALFRFNACSIQTRIGTLPTVTSANPQSTSTAPNYTVYPGTGITVTCSIPNNNVYTPVQLASAMSSAYTSATPSPVFMNVGWNSTIERFVFTKSPVTSGDPALFRFVNTSTLNAAIGNLDFVNPLNPQQTLSGPFFEPAMKVNSLNNSLVTYIDPYNNILPIDNTNNLLVTNVDAYNNLLPIDNTNNSIVVYVDPLPVMTVDSTNYQLKVEVLSAPTWSIINVPFGTYTVTGYATTVTQLFALDPYASGLTMVWRTDLVPNRFQLVLTTNNFAIPSPSSFPVTSPGTLNLIVFSTQGYGSFWVADVPPTTSTYPNTNVTVTVPIPNSPTIYDYTAVTLATAMQTAFSAASVGMSVIWNAGTQRFAFTKTPLLTGDPGLFRFTGASTINTRIGTLPTASSANPQTTSTAPVFTTYPGTGITVSFNVPNSLGYTAPTLAAAITNQYLNYSPSINITCAYNFSTQRFDFTKLPVSPGDPALFRFNVSSTINTRIGTLPTAVSANPQTTTTAPVFTQNPATGITVSLTVPVSPNIYQYIPTQLANQITLAYTNYVPSIAITAKWNPATERFVFTRTGLDANDPGLFRFTGASTINSTIGGLPTVVSANPQTTLSVPTFGPWPGTGEVIVLTVPNGIYTCSQLAQQIEDLYNSYFPGVPSTIFHMDVVWNPSTLRFTFSKTPISSSDPGNFQFLYAYNPITTITQLIGALPFGVSGNPLSTLTNPSTPPSLIVPDGSLAIEEGQLNLQIKVYPK